jgi:hypothetical protein
VADENNKILMAVIAAGSVGGFSGHTIGTSNETTVNSSTIESCIEFSKHARSHERLTCDQEKLQIKLDCSCKNIK